MFMSVEMFETIWVQGWWVCFIRLKSKIVWRVGWGEKIVVWIGALKMQKNKLKSLLPRIKDKFWILPQQSGQTFLVTNHLFKVFGPNIGTNPLWKWKVQAGKPNGKYSPNNLKTVKKSHLLN